MGEDRSADQCGSAPWPGLSALPGRAGDRPQGDDPSQFRAPLAGFACSLLLGAIADAAFHAVGWVRTPFFLAITLAATSLREHRRWLRVPAGAAQPLTRGQANRVDSGKIEPTVSQTAPEHVINCDPMRVLEEISVSSPAPHHSRAGSATHAATRWLMAPGQPSRGSSPAPMAQRGPRKPPDLAALGAVHGGEPSRPPEGRQSLPVGPAHLFNPNRRHATGNADEVRSGAVITGQCGPILLPPRCLEDQEGLTASGDQASDLDFLVAGAGFEPATSGL
jgi:hypothetical protein